MVLNYPLRIIHLLLVCLLCMKLCLIQLPTQNITSYLDSSMTVFQKTISVGKMQTTLPTYFGHYTVNIYRLKTIMTNGNTYAIPTTSKSFSLYWEFLQPLCVIYQKMVTYLQRLKEFPVQAKGFAGSWNDTSISISHIVLYLQIFTVCIIRAIFQVQ